MTVETEEILKETIAASQQDPTEVFAPRHDAPAQQPAQPELLGEKKTAASESDEANEMDAKVLLPFLVNKVLKFRHPRNKKMIMQRTSRRSRLIFFPRMLMIFQSWSHNTVCL